MDRPAYELVRLLEAVLDDADQFTDSPENPNRMYIWAIREILEDFGGQPHRWSHPRCECNHTVGFHRFGRCELCDCMLTSDEALNGRDEDLDEEILRAIQPE